MQAPSVSSSAPPSASQRSSRMGEAQGPYYQPPIFSPPPPPPMIPYYGGGRKIEEGRDRSYVMVGIVQVIFGLLCFVLALIAISVTINASLYSAGAITGPIFILTGVFGCMTGSSLADCYAMTYLILNIVSDVAAAACIGLSGWEIYRIGSMDSVASDDYLAVKGSLMIVSCVFMLGLCTLQARKLRGTPCCSFQEDSKAEGKQAALGCIDPASNTTTHSSWQYNLQHNVNQPSPNVQGQRALQDPNLPREYLSQMEETRYSPEPWQDFRARERESQLQPAYM